MRHLFDDAALFQGDWMRVFACPHCGAYEATRWSLPHDRAWQCRACGATWLASDEADRAQEG